MVLLVLKHLYWRVHKIMKHNFTRENTVWA